MLNGAGLEGDLRSGLWAECASTATMLDNLDCEGKSKTPRYKMFMKKDWKGFDNMRKFGEVGIMTVRDKIKAKMKNRGIPCLYLGHAEDHGGDVHRLLKLETRRVVRSRDLRWLDKNLKDYKRDKGDFEDEDDDVADDGDARNFEIEDSKIEDAAEDVEVVPSPEKTKTVRWSDAGAGRVLRSNVGRTRSGAVYKPSDDLETVNPRLLRELSGELANPEATAALDQVKESVVPDTVDTIDMANLQLLMKEREPMFEEIALFGSSEILETKPVEMKAVENGVGALKMKIEGLHIVDKLRCIDEDVAADEDSKATLLRELVQDLKDQLPADYGGAWDHPDAKLRMLWRAAISKELKSLVEDRKVWSVMKKMDIPEGRRCVKSKWVFDVKRSGLFKARLVACGYSQIPGVDFTESYAPVINDVCWRILIVVMMVLKLDYKIIDVETAFLFGDLEEEVYMTCDAVHKEDEALKLKHAIYGLVQASRQFWKKYTDKLKKIGFVGGYPDPCLYSRRDEYGVVFLAVWVDDSLLVGDKKAIDMAVQDLKNEGFSLKEDGSLDDYLSCEITMNKDKTVGWIHQPHLITKLENRFGEMVKELKTFKTPSAPGGRVIKDHGGPVVDAERHKLYRTGVGMLLYLVKHTRPDIANGVRELSKALVGPSEAAYKDMLRMIKFVLETRNKAVKLKPVFEEVVEIVWNVLAYSDSDWAGDCETRASVAGFILYLMGVPISWRSKIMKVVAQSSTEAEYIALSEAAKEVKFVYQVLVSLGFKVKLPIIVRVDNLGAIFMSDNISVSQRTKHVDVRYRFVQQFSLDGFIKVVFVKTDENDADLFTKNLEGDKY